MRLPLLPLLTAALLTQACFTDTYDPYEMDVFDAGTLPGPGPRPTGEGRLTGALIVAGASGATAQTQMTVSAEQTGSPQRMLEIARQAKTLVAKKGQGRPELPQPATVPGELIVRFEEGEVTPAEALRRTLVEGVRCSHAGYASAHLHLLRCHGADGRLLDEGALRELGQTLERRPGIRFTQLNGIQEAHAVPNDPFYGDQWHYPAMKLPEAWSVTTGSSNVVVAVVDTGIISHPDLSPNVLPGVDLISDSDRARDGDGRDDDATDEGGDRPQGGSSWHGTHVAGTVAAVSNNGVGVAGVAWNARILPVRVLGKGGGTDFDIAAGIAWASGQSVPGVRSNTTPAKIVNMSLGGDGPPAQVYQDVIDGAVSRGSVVVVAAGNDDESASNKTPCNQQRVICVGATGFDGTITRYSNFGTELDVMAPGGDISRDLDGNGEEDGVLSTYANASGAPTYGGLQGTSMAAPHVAGLVALMASVNPSINHAQAEAVLVATANPAYKCNIGCGAGLVDAWAAVNMASGQMGTGPGKLQVSTTSAALRPGEPLSIAVSNMGGEPLTVTASATGPLAAHLSFTNGTNHILQPGSSGAVAIVAEGAALTDGMSGVVNLASSGGSAQVNLTLRMGGTSGQRPAVVVAVYEDSAREWQLGGASLSDPARGHAFELSVPAGKYFLVATVDVDGDESYFEDGEPVGFYKDSQNPVEVTVGAGRTVEGLDFAVYSPTEGGEPQPQPQPDGPAIGGACTANAHCPAGGACATEWPGGYCTQDCRTQGCSAGSACVESGSDAYCLDICGAPGTGRSDCRGGYVCAPLSNGSGVCVPGCTGDDDCATGASCQSDGYCR